MKVNAKMGRRARVAALKATMDQLRKELKELAPLRETRKCSDCGASFRCHPRTSKSQCGPCVRKTRGR